LPGLAKFCIVSPWLENGNIFDHVNKNPDANRFELVSFHRGWQQKPSDYVLHSLHKLPVVSITSIHWILSTAVFIL